MTGREPAFFTRREPIAELTAALRWLSSLALVLGRTVLFLTRLYLLSFLRAALSLIPARRRVRRLSRLETRAEYALWRLQHSDADPPLGKAA